MTTKQAIVLGLIAFAVIFMITYFINRIIGITVKNAKAYKDNC